jgi:hypothetical protein
MLVPAITQDRRSARRQQLRYERRLANARLAGDQHNPPAARDCLVEAQGKHPPLLAPTDERVLRKGRPTLFDPSRLRLTARHGKIHERRPRPPAPRTPIAAED